MVAKTVKGTVFDFKETEGVWFDYFESHIDLQEGGVIYDKPIAGTGQARFRSTRPFIQEFAKKREKEKQTKFVLNTKSKAMEWVEWIPSLTVDEQKQYADDMVDYACTGLERFFDAEGNALECTRENKLKLVNVPVFDRFMARCLLIQASARIQQEEASEKNLKKP